MLKKRIKLVEQLALRPELPSGSSFIRTEESEGEPTGLVAKQEIALFCWGFIGFLVHNGDFAEQSGISRSGANAPQIKQNQSRLRLSNSWGVALCVYQEPVGPTVCPQRDKRIVGKP